MANPLMTLYGTLWCGDCKCAKKFLAEQRVPYEYVDVEEDRKGLTFIERVDDGKQIVPTILFGDGSIMIEPSSSSALTRIRISSATRWQLTNTGLSSPMRRCGPTVHDVFGAGDCRAGSTRQAASAAGEGAAAALSVRHNLEPLTSGLPRQATGEATAEKPLAPAMA